MAVMSEWTSLILSVANAASNNNTPAKAMANPGSLLRKVLEI
jgi:hypothetical protein